MKAKFKINDVLEVYRRHNGNMGSPIRDNFIVDRIEYYNSYTIYFPDDEKQGAFEGQLRFPSWKKRISAIKNDTNNK